MRKVRGLGLQRDGIAHAFGNRDRFVEDACALGIPPANAVDERRAHSVLTQHRGRAVDGRALADLEAQLKPIVGPVAIGDIDRSAVREAGSQLALEVGRQLAADPATTHYDDVHFRPFPGRHLPRVPSGGRC